MITEEQKQEADRIVEKYYWIFGDGYLGNQHILIAIQDRKSVLEAMTELLNSLQMSSKFAIQLRINNLTNQISYLKSKL